MSVKNMLCPFEEKKTDQRMTVKCSGSVVWTYLLYKQWSGAIQSFAQGYDYSLSVGDIQWTKNKIEEFIVHRHCFSLFVF